MLMMFFLIISFINFDPASTENVIHTNPGNERKEERQKHNPSPPSFLGQLFSLVAPKAHADPVQSKRVKIDATERPSGERENGKIGEERHFADSNTPSDRKRHKGSGQFRDHDGRPKPPLDQVRSHEQYKSPKELNDNELNPHDEINHRKQKLLNNPKVIARQGTVNETDQLTEKNKDKEKKQESQGFFGGLFSSGLKTIGGMFGGSSAKPTDKSPLSKEEKPRSDSDSKAVQKIPIERIENEGTPPPRESKPMRSETQILKGKHGQQSSTAKPSQSKVPVSLINNILTGLNLLGVKERPKDSRRRKDFNKENRDVGPDHRPRADGNEPRRMRKTKLTVDQIHRREQKRPNKQAELTGLLPIFESLFNNKNKPAEKPVAMAKRQHSNVQGSAHRPRKFKQDNVKRPVPKDKQDMSTVENILTALNELDGQRRPQRPKDFSKENRDFGPSDRKRNDSGGKFDGQDESPASDHVVGMRGYREHRQHGGEHEAGKNRVVVIIPVPRGLGSKMKQYQGIMSFLSEALPQVFTA